MNIRLATTDDYEQIASLRNLFTPDLQMTAESIVADDSMRLGKIKHCRWVALVGEIVVGDALYTQHPALYHPNKFVIELNVLPEFQARLVGSSLYDTLTKALDQHKPISLQVYVRDSQAAGLKFLSKRGYTELARERMSYLYVEKFDLNKFSSLESNLSDSRIRFRKLAELLNDPDQMRTLYELDWEMYNDMPGLSGPLVKPTYDDWFKNSINHYALKKGSFQIAFKDDEQIGYSYLWGKSDHGLIHNGMTGVKKTYRGLGVAKMLKLLGVKFAKEHRYEILCTRNSIVNASVLALNEKIGYQKQYDTIEMIKRIGE